MRSPLLLTATIAALATGCGERPSAAAADGAAGIGPVVVTVSAPAVPHRLDPAWYGSGTEYYCRGFTGALKHPAAMQAIRDTGIGFLRWPQGTSALWYFWDAPEQSYKEAWMGAGAFLSPDDFVAAAKQLDVDSLVQVNTVQFRKGDGGFERSKVLVAPMNVAEAAAYAGRWVADLKAKNTGIRWWEIGNEDWVYWTGRQHGSMATAFAKAMRAADPSARILAQGFIGTWNSDWLHSEGGAWTREVAESVPAAAVDGLSVHMYLNGGRMKSGARSVGEETAALFAKVASDDRIAACRAQLAEKDRAGWQVWVTEYNLMQSDAKGPGGLLWWQNLAHGLVIADWTGRMLVQGADRLAVHDLVGHPVFELVDAAHKGTVDAPRLTVPALALQAFRGFGDELLAVSTAANPDRLSGTAEDGTAVRTIRYPAVSAYAARRGADGSVRVILVNRDLEHAVPVRVGGLAALPPGASATLRQLGAGLDLAADNFGKVQLAWSERQLDAAALAALELPAHSLSVLVLPAPR